MCGVCGIYHYANGARIDAGVLESMCDVITHRGPDDAGYYIDDTIGLAMRRLIIIDPTTGHQPLFNENKSVCLVFNGEIYNFKTIRDELIARGHAFATQSDGEVIVHLYEDEGPACLDRLRGMFAIALWDSDKRSLFLARDRIGIKPYYYADHNGTLLFASEIKSILQYPRFPRSVHPQGIHHYLSLNYVPAPYTLIEGIHQLLPGEYMLCTKEGFDKRRYWDVRFEPREDLGEEEWKVKVRDKLQECVSMHLVSDVPFGAFLSGGIDSSAVVAMMTSALGTPISTFSIDFAEESFSEIRYARVIADLFHSDHHVLSAPADVLNMLETLIWHADDPLADSSMIPVYMIAEFARKHVTMVLTGDGGDEIFAGYDTYNAYYVRRMYRLLPRWLRQQVVRRVVEALPVSLTKVSFDFKAKRFVEGAELDADEAHFWWRVILSESAKSNLYTGSFRDAVGNVATADIYRDYFRMSGSDDPLSRMLYVDTRFYLPNDMLVKVDRMTMANALEARVPFLDHELVELAATIPSSIKFKKRIKKYILKEALRDLLPGSILDRKKAGFNVPVNAWLAGKMKAMAQELLSPERIGQVGFFEPSYVSKLLAEHLARKADHSFPLWGLMCFQIWYERFIGPDTVVPPKSVTDRWGYAKRANKRSHSAKNE
ncbi:MAG: asparagine synthase (glutamine-hydrolyzing) [Candidatus Latescibacterota bacterium]